MSHLPLAVPLPTAIVAPATSWVLDGLPTDSALALERLLERLEDLPADAWWAIGTRCGCRDAHMAELQARAVAAVNGAIATRGLSITAWFIGDLVATASYRVLRQTQCAPRRVRRAHCAARAAAEWTALATAMRGWIPAHHHTTLCAPFADVCALPLLLIDRPGPTRPRVER